MSIQEDVVTPAEVWAQVQDVVTVWLVPAGVALAALVVLLVVLIGIRRHGLFLAGRAVTMPLVLAWEAQGLHELALATGLDGPAAWAVALLTSAILATLAVGADEHHRRHGTLGWPGRLVWVVAVPMGLIVSLTADNAAVFALRIALPLLVALLWWVKYAPVISKASADAGAATPSRRAGSWRWTPRRIGVAFGLLDPTDADLSQVHAEREIRRLTTTAHKLHHGSPRLRGLRAAKLRRLGLVATPEMIAEVHRRVSLVHEISRLTDPAQRHVDMSGADIAGRADHAGLARRLGPAVTAPASSALEHPELDPEQGGTPGTTAEGSGPELAGTAVASSPRNSGRSSAPVRLRKAAARSAAQRRGSAPDQGGASAAERIRGLVSQYPDLTRAELAARAGTSDRYVRKVLGGGGTGAESAPEPPERVNGHRPELADRN